MQVEFCHKGTYKLKGVTDDQTVMQINSAQFSGRAFPAKPASGKAEIVSPPWPIWSHKFTGIVSITKDQSIKY